MSREDTEILLGSAVQLAEKLLKKNGEFYPFGLSMDQAGKITMAGTYDGNDQPESLDVIRMLEEGLRTSAKNGVVRGIAICCDIRVVPPGKAEKTDAIQVRIEHKDGQALNVVVPYHKEPNIEVEYDSVFALSGSTTIFV